MLDFGSGSGILAIAAARLGARVDAVEIDLQALAHARLNAHLNGLEESIRFASEPPPADEPYALVVANILRPVLLETSTELATRLKPGGTLILSGLVATDLPEVSVRYSALLGGRQPQAFAQGEWRALVWSA